MKRLGLLVLALAMLFVGVAGAQKYPLLDMIADKVVQKYQQATCEQLWQQKAQPKSAQEQNLIQMLRTNPEARAEFINRVAAPMANKMFECGMIPSAPHA